MTKIDIDELERKARQAIARGVVHDYPEPAQAVTLALIARIRELEVALRDCVYDGAIPSPRSIQGERRMIAILERGAVLP